MKEMYDFLQAALPLIAIGLSLAVFFEKRTDSKSKDYRTEGMCLGMCFGTAVSAKSGNNVAIGLSFGMMTGFSIGSSMRKERQNNKK